jgi:hypothetical protein
VEFHQLPHVGAVVSKVECAFVFSKKIQTQQEQTNKMRQHSRDHAAKPISPHHRHWVILSLKKDFDNARRHARPTYPV